MKLLPPLMSAVALATAVACSAASPAVQEVLQTEQARVAALIADDYAALDLLLADDLTYTHSSSVVDTKAEFMESLTSGRLKYKVLNHRDQQVRVYGDTAILNGVTQVHSTFEEREVHLVMRFTIVYVRKSGRWQMAAWQSTRVPG